MKNFSRKTSPTGPAKKMRTGLLAVAVAALFCIGSATPALARDEGQPQMNLRRIDLTAGMYRIDTQLATTEREREIGLMFRKEMPQQEGMLFVFEIPGVQCFWMRNTILPLTAAFVADDGTIVNLADMQPMAEDSHCSAKPVRYVLEMNQGWFKSKNIQVGSKISGAPFQPRP